MEIISNPTIVRKTDIPATLLAIPSNTAARFRARTFAPYASVRSAISRLNGSGEVFTATTDDNGETYLVTRK